MNRRCSTVGRDRWDAARRVGVVGAIVGLSVILGMASGGGRVMAESYAGTSAYLDIGMGARALAMGGAFVAVADDATALHYNPAGLADVASWELSSFYSTQYGAAGYGAVVLAGRGLGGGVQWVRSTDVPLADEWSNRTGEFDLSQTAWRVGYGGRIGNVAVGVALAHIRDRYSSTSGSGLTGDAGALVTVGPVRLGFAARHFWGQRTSSTGTKEPFEPELVVGASWKSGSLLVAAERSFSGPVRAGVEYRLGRSLALRAGAWAEDGYFNWSAGAGIGLGSVAVDYAYADDGMLPGTHRVSLSYRF